jgi:formate hydrogenlyase subunit 6/NADH:ubiquinone oxidoreductase subunit I
MGDLMSEKNFEKNTESDTQARIYVMGRLYLVPKGLTIMKAMEYVGYKFIRGAGCRGGFCGACSTIYRKKGDFRLKVALACSQLVEDDMYLTQIPFTPTDKSIYDINDLRPSSNVLLIHYPEIARCVSCNTCSKACPQDLEVMDYIQAAIKGDFEEITNLSFDCISCGLCVIRCPMEISPNRVAELARRLYGKYVIPKARHVDERIEEIERGDFDDELDRLSGTSKDELVSMYEERDIEV